MLRKWNSCTMEMWGLISTMLSTRAPFDKAESLASSGESSFLINDAHSDH
jgi:hypothetical protein